MLTSIAAITVVMVRLIMWMSMMEDSEDVYVELTV